MSEINRVMETKISELCIKYIYATIADIDSIDESDAKFSNIIYQSYDNLMKEKVNQLASLTGRFTLVTDSKQHLAYLFSQFIEELCIIDIDENDTIELLIEKLETDSANVFASYMLKLGAKYCHEFTPTLKSSTDVKRWCFSKISESLQDKTGNIVILSKISEGFDHFLKAISYCIGKFVWHAKTPISSKILLGLLSVTGLPQDHINIVQVNIRPKAKKGKKQRTEVEKKNLFDEVDNSLQTQVVEKGSDSDSDLTTSHI